MNRSGKTHSSVIALCMAFASFIVYCNLYLFQPLLPYMATYFQISSSTANWLLAASTIALSLTLLPWAAVSERYGRRRIMVIGIVTLPLLNIGMLCSDSWWILIFARVGVGIAAAAFTAVAIAYMVEELAHDAFIKTMGMYVAANSFGGICGRLLGGVITSLTNWEMAVFVMAIISGIGAFIVQRYLPRQKHFTPSDISFSRQLKTLWDNYCNPELCFAMLIGGINFALFVNLYSVMGFRLEAEPYSLSVGLTSLIFVCYFGGILSSNLTTIWKKKYSAVAGMALGAFISLSGMLITTVENIPAVIAGLLLISVGALFTHTLAYGWVGQHAIKAKATATALYLVHYYAGGSLGGFYLLYFWEKGNWEEVITGGGILYASLFSVVWLLWRTHAKIRKRNRYCISSE